MASHLVVKREQYVIGEPWWVYSVLLYVGTVPKANPVVDWAVQRIDLFWSCSDDASSYTNKGITLHMDMLWSM